MGFSTNDKIELPLVDTSRQDWASDFLENIDGNTNPS